jgi:Flavin containing amine oxidoreductase
MPPHDYFHYRGRESVLQLSRSICFTQFISGMHLLSDTILSDALASSTHSLTSSLSLLLSIVRILRPSTPDGLAGLSSAPSLIASDIAAPAQQSYVTEPSDFQVLVLGGGVTGVMAAETLHRRGINNFKIVEARETLGGRMKNFSFGAADREYVLELGADWIHGTQTDNGPSNPIFDLARKHNLLTQPNHYHGSMSMF